MMESFRSAATRRRFCSPRLVAANPPLTSQRSKKRERAPALRKRFASPGWEIQILRAEEPFTRAAVDSGSKKFADVVQHLLKHFRSQAAGLSVLLAGVVGAKQAGRTRGRIQIRGV